MSPLHYLLPEGAPAHACNSDRGTCTAPWTAPRMFTTPIAARGIALTVHTLGGKLDLVNSTLCTTLQAASQSFLPPVCVKPLGNMLYV